MSHSPRVSDAQNLSRLSSPDDCLRILQLTDTHLYATPGSRLLGVDTLLSLQQSLDTFRACGWPVDLILCTGDLVHDASARGYRKLARLLDTFDVPVYCLPGNHDLPSVMYANLSGKRVDCPHSVDVGPWRLVLLNSVVDGEVGGCLDDDELERLQQALEDRSRHALIALHHHPIPVHSRWIDQLGLRNGPQLLAAIEDKENVKGIVFGHVHQAFEAYSGHTRLMGSPSTCIQFAPGTDKFKLDDAAPGFRLIELHAQGTIHSRIVRSLEQPADLNLAAHGY